MLLSVFLRSRKFLNTKATQINVDQLKADKKTLEAQLVDINDLIADFETLVSENIDKTPVK